RVAAEDAEDFRVFEGGDVEPDGLLGRVVGGQARRALRPLVRLVALVWFSFGRHVPTSRRHSCIESAAPLDSDDEERAVLPGDAQSEGSETLNGSRGGNSTWTSLTRRVCGNA